MLAHLHIHGLHNQRRWNCSSSLLRVCDLPCGRDTGDGRPWLLMFLALTVEAELHVHEFAALLANSLPPQIHGPLYLALCVVWYRLYGSYAICSWAPAAPAETLREDNQAAHTRESRQPVSQPPVD
jgi:hypothetical protein